ncbi:MAG: hypothetical protein HOQ24_08140, partial [Mycobacteriaceae bacterium]|nr:hypothetical protein [Mycobacteriaceae bacterium]
MELTELIVRGLRELAPLGWERMDAWFAVTVVAESAVVVAEVGVESVRCAVPEPVWRAVREHRWESARSGGAPWWRLAIRLEADSVEVEVDHGAEVFPAEQLFAPAAYLADLEVFPRARLPVWLAAYIGRGVPQSRPPPRGREWFLQNDPWSASGALH